MKTLEERIAVIEEALRIDKARGNKLAIKLFTEVPVIHRIKEKLRYHSDGINCLRDAMSGVEEHISENDSIFLTWVDKHPQVNEIDDIDEAQGR